MIERLSTLNQRMLALKSFSPTKSQSSRPDDERSMVVKPASYSRSISYLLRAKLSHSVISDRNPVEQFESRHPDPSPTRSLWTVPVLSSDTFESHWWWSQIWYRTLEQSNTARSDRKSGVDRCRTSSIVQSLDYRRWCYCSPSKDWRKDKDVGVDRPCLT